MKKFIIAVAIIFSLALVGLYLYFYEGWGGFLFPKDGNVQALVKTEGRAVLVDGGEGFEDFELRGVDLGAGEPGHFATDYALDKETYLRWFKQIQDMGANTIRVYTLLGDAFYEAFYEYNMGNPNPLYLVHGVWLNDYSGFSHMDGFDDEYQAKLAEDSRAVIDAVHGRRIVELGRVAGTGSYRWDVSPWVLGYIVGVEWEPSTVAYTDHAQAERRGYEGRYLRTSQDATPFETMLAQLGDEILGYESRRYGEQRLLAFSNWPSTDPLEYPQQVRELFDKYASVDVEHIVATDEVKSGMFASYHVYPYFPDYARYVEELAQTTDDTGQVNTYYAYLKTLVDHHSIPVVIAEYGIPAARGMAQQDHNTGRNQGNTDEQAQAEEIVRCYHDIRQAGAAGSFVFEWQDEWFKRTWNTVYATDQQKTPYWPDWQTNEQFFGLLAFEPGNERSVSYVDGDLEEWRDEDVVSRGDGLALSAKYDEKFLYLMVRTDDGSALGKDVYLPLDTTSKSGAYASDPAVLTTWARPEDDAAAESVEGQAGADGAGADAAAGQDADGAAAGTGAIAEERTFVDAQVGELPRMTFERGVDFIVSLHRDGDSRVVVQERSECLRAMMMWRLALDDAFANPPASDSETFRTIELALRTVRDAASGATADEGDLPAIGADDPRTYETGLLREGDANPSHEGFDSLADYRFGDDFVEVRLPWQLLNFSSPAEMLVHDDYYEHYGVENLAIQGIGVGAVRNAEGAQVPLADLALKGWGVKPTYHERLKASYYALQDVWTSDDPAFAAAEVARAVAQEQAQADASGEKTVESGALADAH